jgi:hypothetical protein
MPLPLGSPFRLPGTSRPAHRGRDRPVLRAGKGQGPEEGRSPAALSGVVRVLGRIGQKNFALTEKKSRTPQRSQPGPAAIRALKRRLPGSPRQGVAWPVVRVRRGELEPLFRRCAAGISRRRNGPPSRGPSLRLVAGWQRRVRNGTGLLGRDRINRPSQQPVAGALAVGWDATQRRPGNQDGGQR